MSKARVGVPGAPFLLLTSVRDRGSPSTVVRSKGQFRFWGVQEAGGIDPLPWDPPAQLLRQPWATAVLWNCTLGRPELLLGASWEPGSPLHTASPEPEVVSTTGRPGGTEALEGWPRRSQPSPVEKTQ